MAAAGGALVAQGVHVEGGEDDLLPRSRVGLGQQAAVVVDHHRAAGPGERRVVLEAGGLVGGHHVGDVLHRSAAVDQRPPVHRRRCPPRIHVGRDPDQHLGAVGGQLAQGLGEQPVVADGDPQVADLGLGHRKHLLVVAGDVVGAGVHLPGDPGVHLAVPGEDAVGADQAGGVEHHFAVLVVALEEGAGLDVDAVLACLLLVALGVLVGDLDRQLVVELAGGGEDRRGVRELGEDHQLDGNDRSVALDRHVDHPQHAVDVRLDAAAMGRILEVHLAGGGAVAQCLFAARCLVRAHSRFSIVERRILAGPIAGPGTRSFLVPPRDLSIPPWLLTPAGP